MPPSNQCDSHCRFLTNRPCHLKLHEDRLGDDHKDDGRVKRLSLLRDKVREIARSEYGSDPEWGESYPLSFQG